MHWMILFHMVKCYYRHTSKAEYIFWMKIIQVTFEKTIFLHLLHIGVSKPDFSKQIVQNIYQRMLCIFF